jgi:tetratricopeptide (TPR) repeat protein
VIRLNKSPSILFTLFAVQDDLSSVLSSNPSDITGWLNVSQILLSNSLADMALESFAAASRLDPANPFPHEESALIYELHHQDYDSALAAVSRAIHRASRRATVFYCAGNLHSAQGRPERAATLHRRAIELEPTYFEAYNNLGSAYINMANAVDMSLEPQVLYLLFCPHATSLFRIHPARVTKTSITAMRRLMRQHRRRRRWLKRRRRRRRRRSA